MWVVTPQSVLIAIGTQIEHTSCKPLSYPVHARENFITSLILKLVIQSFYVMITYLVSEHANIRGGVSNIFEIKIVNIDFSLR